MTASVSARLRLDRASSGVDAVSGRQWVGNFLVDRRFVGGIWMGRIVVVTYRPKPEKCAALLAEVTKHLAVFTLQDFATSREARAMRAGDGPAT